MGQVTPYVELCVLCGHSVASDRCRGGLWVQFLLGELKIIFPNYFKSLIGYLSRISTKHYIHHSFIFFTFIIYLLGYYKECILFSINIFYIKIPTNEAGKIN